MKSPFFIYALPRSGTAWLAVFLTAFDSYCYHEPLADMTPMQLGARIAQRPDWTVGAIDTGAYRLGVPGTLRDAIAGVRPFVLRRDTRAIQKSSDNAGVAYDAAHELGVLLNVTHGMPELHFERLGDVHYLREMWALLIGTPFDLERAQFFLEMNIQRDPTRFFGRRPRLLGPGAIEERRCH